MWGSKVKTQLNSRKPSRNQGESAILSFMEPKVRMETMMKQRFFFLQMFGCLKRLLMTSNQCQDGKKCPGSVE